MAALWPSQDSWQSDQNTTTTNTNNTSDCISSGSSSDTKRPQQEELEEEEKSFTEEDIEGKKEEGDVVFRYQWLVKWCDWIQSKIPRPHFKYTVNPLGKKEDIVP